MTGPEQGGGRKPRSPLAYAGMGFELALPVLIFLYVGYRLDRWLASDPWLLLLGAFVGMAVGMYTLFRRVLGSSGSGDGGAS